MTQEYNTVVVGTSILFFLLLFIHPQPSLGNTHQPGRFPVVPVAVEPHVLFVCLWEMLPVAVPKPPPLSAVMGVAANKIVNEPRHFLHKYPSRPK